MRRNRDRRDTGLVQRRKIYDGTEPHILVEIEDLVESEGRLLVVRVPRGMPPHMTTEGVGRIRVGKECKPLTGLELVRDGEVTLAAVLLVGRSTALARWAPQHEVIFLRYRTPTKYDVRHDLRGAILAVLDSLERVLKTHLLVDTVDAGGFRELTIPDVSWFAAREAVLNALVHRDYFLRQAVYVELREQRIEISSPGGFAGGVTPDNILRHPPVRRNPLLARALQESGFVNRAGVGVDRIYEELLR